MNTETIVRRIEALEAKTVARGCSPEEAATAARAAKRLREQYNIKPRTQSRPKSQPREDAWVDVVVTPEKGIYFNEDLSFKDGRSTTKVRLFDVQRNRIYPRATVLQEKRLFRKPLYGYDGGSWVSAQQFNRVHLDGTGHSWS